MWVGDEPGVATRLKLVLNHWLVDCATALAETIAFAQSLGVDPNLFLDAIDGGALGMPYARVKGPLMLERSYPPSFPVRLVRKDVGLMLEAARDAGFDLRMAAVAAELFDRAAADGHADDDLAAVYEAVRPRP
jgi:3-hydroxyisobutyrate dehydrogenase